MENLERQAIHLMVYRMVVALTFFLSALGIQAAIGGESSLRPFYFFIASVLFFNLIHLLIYLFFKDFRRSPAFIYLQLGGDILGITLLAFLTGGFSSLFTLLYPILIVVAGFLLKKRGAFVIAFLNSIVFGMLCVGLFYGWLRPERFSEAPWEPPTAQDTLYALMSQYVGFFLIASLVSVMSGRLETTRATLGIVQKDLSTLRHLNDQIVSSLAGGLVTTDIQGRVTFANDAALRILCERLASGWNLFERLRGLCVGGTPPPDPPSEREHEVQLELAEDRHLLLLLTPLLEGTSTVGHLAFLKDQTEMVRLKRQLEVRERMAATGEMAANIAHEIRNPLGSISGSAQMLRRSVPEGSSEKALLTIIQNESHRLSDILDNFVRFSNPPPLQMVSLDLKPLISETLSLFRHDPKGAGHLSLREDLGEPVPAVMADPDRVRQALWNILLNARKAIAGEGHIRVGLLSDAHHAILQVEDDGAGMDPQRIPDYLQPFRKGFSKGAGLGLSVTYRIMEQHGGRMEIRSAPGRGTICSLLFPLSNATPAGPRADRPN